MNNTFSVNRRNFLLGTSAAAGLSYANYPNKSLYSNNRQVDRLPREVWIASVSKEGLKRARTNDELMKHIIERMENVVPLQPDIICLPEVCFPCRQPYP